MGIRVGSGDTKLYEHDDPNFGEWFCGLRPWKYNAHWAQGHGLDKGGKVTGKIYNQYGLAKDVVWYWCSKSETATHSKCLYSVSDSKAPFGLAGSQILYQTLQKGKNYLLLFHKTKRPSNWILVEKDKFEANGNWKGSGVPERWVATSNKSSMFANEDYQGPNGPNGKNTGDTQKLKGLYKNKYIPYKSAYNLLGYRIYPGFQSINQTWGHQMCGYRGTLGSNPDGGLYVQDWMGLAYPASFEYTEEGSHQYYGGPIWGAQNWTGQSKESDWDHND